MLKEAWINLSQEGQKILKKYYENGTTDEILELLLTANRDAHTGLILALEMKIDKMKAEIAKLKGE
jgi:hypothetical protein